MTEGLVVAASFLVVCGLIWFFNVSLEFDKS